eukprot:GHVT01084568.1.p1 GENE.GHVT01084568.1~~GHVT01084568.1.p1  ORF type:complete len:688 (-),score=156.17 GHVT01084568.1:1025-2968(-)
MLAALRPAAEASPVARAAVRALPLLTSQASQSRAAWAQHKAEMSYTPVVQQALDAVLTGASPLPDATAAATPVWDVFSSPSRRLQPTASPGALRLDQADAELLRAVFLRVASAVGGSKTEQPTLSVKNAQTLARNALKTVQGALVSVPSAIGKQAHGDPKMLAAVVTVTRNSASRHALLEAIEAATGVEVQENAIESVEAQEALHDATLVAAALQEDDQPAAVVGQDLAASSAYSGSVPVVGELTVFDLCGVALSPRQLLLCPHESVNVAPVVSALESATPCVGRDVLPAGLVLFEVSLRTLSRERVTDQLGRPIVIHELVDLTALLSRSAKPSAVSAKSETAPKGKVLNAPLNSWPVSRPDNEQLVQCPDDLLGLRLLSVPRTSFVEEAGHKGNLWKTFVTLQLAQTLRVSPDDIRICKVFEHHDTLIGFTVAQPSASLPTPVWLRRLTGSSSGVSSTSGHRLLGGRVLHVDSSFPSQVSVRQLQSALAQEANVASLIPSTSTKDVRPPTYWATGPMPTLTPSTGGPQHSAAPLDLPPWAWVLIAFGVALAITVSILMYVGVRQRSAQDETSPKSRLRVATRGVAFETQGRPITRASTLEGVEDQGETAAPPVIAHGGRPGNAATGSIAVGRPLETEQDVADEFAR